MADIGINYLVATISSLPRLFYARDFLILKGKIPTR